MTLTHKPVILSEAEVERSATPAKSKDLAFLSMVLAALVFFLTVGASAQTLTGTVKNSTNNKPAAGDDVVLIKLGQGMEEAGRTKADSKGNFSFKLNEQGPHLVRAIHQGVTYHRMAPPGTTSVEVEVFDVSKKLDSGLEVVADIMRFQAGQGQLDVQRIFAVQNTSKPPRTQMNDRNLEFLIPDGAKIVDDSGTAVTQGGNPIKSAPVPVDAKKTRYAFLFPLRPGTTQFEVEYQLPYAGKASIDPKSLYSLQHFVAIVPKGMQFSASGTSFQQMNDPRQPDANVQVASNAQAGQSLPFQISGEGTLGDRQENAGAPGPQGGSAEGDRPGGGLGPPIDAPDPLQKYRWWLLGGFAVALVVGGIVVATRQQAAQRTARATAGLSHIEDAEDFEVPATPKASRPSAPKPRPASVAQVEVQPAQRTSSKLLDALKDELFDLEVEHKQGRISQQEYETTKAALDQTLQRALKREAQKA